MAEEQSAPDNYEALAAELEAYDAEPTPLKPGQVARPDLKNIEEAPPLEEPEPAPEAKAEEKPPEGETEAEKAERVRDEKGRFVSKDGEKPPEKAADGTDTLSEAPPSTESKPDSVYEKAKKERDRQESVLKNFNEEKARVRAEQDARESELKRLRDEVEAKLRAPQAERRDQYGNVIYPSKVYFDNARDWLKKAAKGETGPNGEDYAELAEQAERAGVEAQRSEYQEAQTQFANTQRSNALEVMKGEPELADENGPLAKQLQSVFAQELERAQKEKRMSIFQMLPNGFWYATEVAKLGLKAAAHDTLKTELEQARAEISRLNKLTSVSGSSPTRPSEPKPFEEMSTDEQLAAMDRTARAAGYAVIQK